MKMRRLGMFEVSALGLGCMNFSHAYGAPIGRAAASALINEALAHGLNFFDTAALYGFGENETLLGELLAPHRQRIILASKCGATGVAGQRVIDGRPDTLKRTCEESLRRLKTEVIDLYYLHRWDRQVPIEESVGALSELVTQGKIRAIGLSEVSAATLQKAHAVHPITAVQSEYSLWTRNPEIAVLDACARLNIGFVAFSPLARGFLAGRLPTLESLGELAETDIRRMMPRFQPDHYAGNLRYFQAFNTLAREAGYTPAALALAWLLHQGEHIVPIPGTIALAHLQENLSAAALRVPSPLLNALHALSERYPIQGERYDARTAQEVDTENVVP